MHVPNVDDLPDEATNEKIEWQQENIKSLLNVPMTYQGQLIGFLGFDSVRTYKEWPQDTINILKTVGAIIVSALVRKRVYEDLKDSERRLADIISFLPDATLAIDTEGKVIAWNHAMENLSGVKAEDILGKGNYEYAIPFYGERRPALIDLALHPNEEIAKLYPDVQVDGEQLKIELYLSTPVKSSVYILATATKLYNARGEVIGAIESLRDISERKKSEDALRESEERYRILFENSPDIVMGLS